MSTAIYRRSAGGQPGPALGMRWSGQPTNAQHDDYLAKHGQIYEFYRTDGDRGSKSTLATSTGSANAAQLFLNRSSNTRGAVMSNWPLCVGGTSLTDRTNQLADAASGGMDATWRSALGLLKDRNVNHFIFCLGIESNGNWYQWGTGAHSTESGYQQRNIDHGNAIRNFVRVAMEAEFLPHSWIFTFSPTLEAWRNYPNDTPLNHYLANAYPGRQYIDAAWPTWYDAPFNVNDRDLVSANQATRDTKWLNRWNGSNQIGWLTSFRNWCGDQAKGGDIPTGFHELSLFSQVEPEFCTVAGDPSDCTNQRDVAINYNQLHLTQGGNGDNHVWMTKMFDWVENPTNYCIGVGHFHELYKHDCSGFYHSGTTRPLSTRHPLAAEVFYARSRATGPFDIRASIAHCIARRPANFGA
jgi:hypothetical protein